jgi:hypothetical protein
LKVFNYGWRSTGLKIRTVEYREKILQKQKYDVIMKSYKKYDCDFSNIFDKFFFWV